jgi:hypothetical protein
MISMTQDGVPSGVRSLLFSGFSSFLWEAPGEADRLLPVASFLVGRSLLLLGGPPGEADRLLAVVSFRVLDMFSKCSSKIT